LKLESGVQWLEEDGNKQWSMALLKTPASIFIISLPNILSLFLLIIKERGWSYQIAAVANQSEAEPP
jgi:hypothetical protein